MLSRERLGQVAIQVAFVAVLLLLWHLATSRQWISVFLLPAATDVGRALIDVLAEGEFWPDLRVTLYEICSAFAIATVLGCTVGYLVCSTRFSVAVFEPLLASLFAVPLILLFPLYVLLFGIGPASKIAVGATIAFFPIALSTIAGFDYVDRVYIRAARSMGASSTQMFARVMLPAALPIILAGLRVGAILSFLACMGSETLASRQGLGHRIVALAETLETARMFVYIFFGVLIAFSLHILVSIVEAQGRKNL